MPQREPLRDLTAGDHDRWRSLWEAYLAFYDQALDDEVTEATWRRVLHGEDGMGALVAVDESDDVIGFAHHVRHPRTWGTRDVCYLEDLMVEPERRGTGVGRSLIDELVERARAWGCERVYWHTQDGNTTARRLYDRVAVLTDDRRYQIEL